MFGCAVFGVRMYRNQCSDAAGISVRVKPESVFGWGRIQCSVGAEIHTQPIEILKFLALAYDAYAYNSWKYNSDAGEGGFIIDNCIRNYEYFKKIVTIIGNGLINGNEYATKACDLFKNLYLCR